MFEELLAEIPDALPRTYSLPPSSRLRKLGSIAEAEAALKSAGGPGNERILLQSSEEAPVPYFSFANERNYGQFTAALDESLFRQKATAERLLTLFLDWAARAKVESGDLNDIDDSSFQNETNLEVLRAAGKSLRDLGLKPWSWKREIDVERNPGHSHFVDGLKFTVAWVNYFGPRMIDLLGESRILGASWKAVRQRDHLIEARLYEDPFRPESREKREIQERVRRELCLDDVAHGLVPK